MGLFSGQGRANAMVLWRNFRALSQIAACLVLGVPLAVATATAQERRQPKILRRETHLVSVNVVVEAKDGSPVKNLEPRDFVILDGGRPQKMAFFSTFTNDPAPTPPRLPPHSFTNAPTRQGPTPPSATIILFDSLNAHWTSQAYAMNHVRDFLRQIRPQDHIAIYVLGDTLKIIHDFTQDDSDLVAAIHAYDRRRSQKPAERRPPERTPIEEFLAGKDIRWRAEIDGHMTGFERVSSLQHDYETALSAFLAIAQHLAGVPGRKELIWVSDGIPDLLLADNLQIYEDARPREMDEAQIEAMRGDIAEIARLMAQSDIAIYPVDAAGLVGPDLGFGNDAGGIDWYGGNSAVLANPDDSYHLAMTSLARRTGGHAYYNRNDLETGIRRAVEDSEFSYELGYYPDHTRWKGEWRKIKVKVDRPGLTVLARNGYFAQGDEPEPLEKAQGSKAGGPKPRGSEVALLSQIAASPLDATQLPITVRLTRASSNAQLQAEVKFNPSSGLSSSAPGTWKGKFEVAFLQADDKGKILDATEKFIDMNLGPTTYKNALRNGVTLSTSLPSFPNATMLSVIVLDQSSGIVGSVHIPLQ
ncbi:MAG: VWA domain-containing protein [Acidobacteriota bacterium]|nr:VWA domain-containing protein [Acidobacteriota bacterium]